MATPLQIRVLFEALDKMTAPVRRMAEGAGGLSKRVVAAKHDLHELQAEAGRIASYTKQTEALARNREKMEAARRQVALLKTEMKETEGSTASLARKLDAAKSSVRNFEAVTSRQAEDLAKMRAGLTAAGVDVEKLGAHEAALAAKIERANHHLHEQSERLERVHKVRELGEGLRERGEKMAMGGAVATTLEGFGLGEFLKESMEKGQEYGQAAAQVQASLKSMGPRAKLTFEQLNEQAEKFADHSLYHADEVLRDVTANMLTFGTISGENFERAQQLALDMATKMKRGPLETTILIGKALNDPIKGVTALRRVGVQLTDTQNQQIKKMLEMNDAAGAQRVILGELQREFGGSAQAMRDATPTAAMSQQWHALQEEVGVTAIKLLPPFVKGLTAITEGVNRMSPASRETLAIVLLTVLAIAPLMTVIGGLMTGIGGLIGIFGAIPGAVTGIPALITGLGGAFSWLATAVGVWAIDIAAFFAPIAEAVAAAGAAVVAFIGLPVELVVAIAAALVAVGVLIYRNWDTIKAGVGRLWEWIKSAFMAGIDWFVAIHERMFEIGAQLVMGIINGVGSMFGALRDKIVGLGKGAVDWFRGVLGIHSPSRVFAELGGHMMGGLALGIDRGADAPINRLHRLSTQLAATMAGGALAMAPAAAGVRIGAAAGATGPSAAGSATVVHHDNRTFHITIQGGVVNPQEHARQLLAEIRRIERTERDSAYRDTD